MDLRKSITHHIDKDGLFGCIFPLVHSLDFDKKVDLKLPSEWRVEGRISIK